MFSENYFNVIPNNFRKFFNLNEILTLRHDQNIGFLYNFTLDRKNILNHLNYIYKKDIVNKIYDNYSKYIINQNNDKLTFSYFLILKIYDINIKDYDTYMEIFINLTAEQNFLSKKNYHIEGILENEYLYVKYDKNNNMYNIYLIIDNDFYEIDNLFI